MDQEKYSHIQELLNNCDLLHKGKTSPNSSSNFDNHFKNSTILITGAAGSIGSEITRQLLNANFKSLILIDNAESPLYHLVEELDLDQYENIEFLLIDIRDKEAMNWLFYTCKPTVIFHTAAYKHVPLMENNAYEAVRLNILATKVLADLAIEFNADKFIFISTDKAVNPISVMGMTKRIAESYLNYLNLNYKTDFKSTRFGNVLGSNGSVLPIFLKQINSGKPITITSYDTTRYFINKNKAGNLILKIAMLKKDDGALFTFNMGNPIKIIDLAKVLIENTSVLEKHDIELIGLRSGEKIHEDLISEGEELEITKYPDILRVKSQQSYTGEKVSFNLLTSINSGMDNSEIKDILSNCILQLDTSPALLFAI